MGNSEMDGDLSEKHHQDGVFSPEWEIYQARIRVVLLCAGPQEIAIIAG